MSPADRKSTRLNSSHTEIYTLSLHDALPICLRHTLVGYAIHHGASFVWAALFEAMRLRAPRDVPGRSEEHTSELQSHRDLHSFPTRRSSDLPAPYARGLRDPPWRLVRLGRALRGHEVACASRCPR